MTPASRPISPRSRQLNSLLARTQDKLAEGAVVFDRAYVQYSYCSPSRNSFMSGRNPDTNRVWNFGDHFREGEGMSWLSLPQYFKASGFLSVGAGKLFHPGWPPRNDEPLSWTEGYEYLCPECDPKFPGYQRHDGKENGAFSCLEQAPNCSYDPPSCFGSSVCVANTSKDEPDYAYQLEDMRIRDRCVDLIRNATGIIYKKSKTPFSRHLIATENDHFTKTRSGQTQGKLRNEWRVCTQHQAHARDSHSFSSAAACTSRTFRGLSRTSSSSASHRQKV